MTCGLRLQISFVQDAAVFIYVLITCPAAPAFWNKGYDSLWANSNEGLGGIGALVVGPCFTPCLKRWFWVRNSLLWLPPLTQKIWRTPVALSFESLVSKATWFVISNTRKLNAAICRKFYRQTNSKRRNCMLGLAQENSTWALCFSSFSNKFLKLRPFCALLHTRFNELKKSMQHRKASKSHLKQNHSVIIMKWLRHLVFFCPCITQLCRKSHHHHHHQSATL